MEVALSIGINTFDLLDIYGNGQCEQLLGKVLKNVVLIFVIRCGFSLSVGFAKMALPILIFRRTIFWTLSMASSSVCRLNAWIVFSFTDRMPSWSLEEVAEAFDQLEQAGKVRHFGVSNQNL